MRVIDNEISENGLSRILVNNGYGDLKVRIGREEIICVRSILMNGNSTIRKLILDDKMDGVLELCKKCEIGSFLEIEKYYSGNFMEVNDENVCDILRFSLYYNDNRIMKICIDYLKNHMNDKIMIGIFDILHNINLDDKILKEFSNVSENYLNKNGFKYLNEDELLLMLNLKSLKFILNKKKLMIIDETWLLNRLLRWYNAVLKQNNNKNDIKEFISILKSTVHFNEVKLEEMEQDNFLELKALEISIEENRNNHICIKAKDISNVVLIQVINECYSEDNLRFSNSEKNELCKRETRKEMMKILLSSDDIKLIEVILNIIIEIKVNDVIPLEVRSKILSMLISEYNTSKRNRTLSCFSLFVDNYEYISTIKCLCGKEILFTILNNEKDLKPKSKESLVNYIMQMELDDKEAEKVDKIIKNDGKTVATNAKESISFSYPQSHYSFMVNEEIKIFPSIDYNIIPSFEDEKLTFGVTTSLPNGLILEKESGIIHGKVSTEMEKKEYIIVCRNKTNEARVKIYFETRLSFFIEKNKNPNIIITNNGRIITNATKSYCHCYINTIIANGIYHIKFKFHQNDKKYDTILLGLSTDNTYSGNNIHNQETTCNYYAVSSRSKDISDYCHIGTVVNKNPNFNHKNGSIYEVIVDLNKREFWVAHNNSKPVLLVKDLPAPLYPYAVSKSNTSIELM